ncbi:suppressor of fused domain protein [Actinomadura decatromicini]|uniref:Suppressor of fused domain protein n=1 Tax=Actinomadura decatromicini TaxID=2604572 RepID=A0A5D3FXB3_9ACTN|nr:suppressor of fused domain protein [Actinomadura decatromicini]TYK52546.1 suppressor of fused domain protein [Actinomadura decatromicini]
MLNVDGWNAIDAALKDRYGDAERLEWDAPTPYRPMGPMPMGQFVTNTIAVYPRNEPVPHWHLIGYALTAPFEERGYEFTLRVPRLPGESAAPNWAMGHLENLASYVAKSGNDFEAGHYIEFPNPIDPDRPGSAIRAGGFVLDPELGRAETPLGEVAFLQFVGITTDELHAAQSWHVEGLMTALAPHLPLLLTNMDRLSLADVPGVANAVREGSRRDGSGTGFLFFHRLDADTSDGVTLELGAEHVPQFTRVLPARVPHGNPLILRGADQPIVLLPGRAVTHNDTGQALEITLPDAVSHAIAAAVRPEPGRYTVDALTVNVIA